MLSPIRQSSTAVNISFETSMHHNELLSDRQRHTSSKFKRKVIQNTKKSSNVLSGVYFTPVFVRVSYITSVCELEYSSKVEWKINPPELVDIKLTVVKLYEKEKMADLLLRISNNSAEELDLTLAVMKQGSDLSIIFESIFFTLGKFNPDQTKDLYLRARTLKHNIDEDIILKVIDMASGVKIEFIVRINLTFPLNSN